MQPIIEIKNIGKQYKIAHARGGYVHLRDVIMNIARKPFSFVKQKAKNAVGLSKKEDFWALKDVNLEVYPGEVIGIIGKNGAGKSTLLKILSQITSPSTGEIILRGKVRSLLEVGTGFHPELTGRENIFLNGAILGMSRREISAGFDQIVEFAGIEKFLDTPVKYYSSGMYVRLAFSVAAHMNPDILMVDEVLAVGDAEFQKKCLGKMEEVASAQGRTILFVSHNLSAVASLCKKTVLLDHGQVKMFGNTSEVIRAYLNEFDHGGTEWRGLAGDETVKIHHTYVKSLDEHASFHTAAPLEVGIEGEIFKPYKNAIIGFTLFSEYGYELAYVLYDDRETSLPPTMQPGPFKKKFIIPGHTLAHGTYRIEFDIGIHNYKRIVHNDGNLTFTVVNVDGLGQRFQINNVRGRNSLFRPSWSAE